MYGDVVSHESLCASYMRSRCFLPCAYRLEVKYCWVLCVSIYIFLLQTTNSWYITGGYTEILPFVLLGFANVLNYGIYSGLWSPFSLKTLLPDKCTRQTVEFAGTLLRIRRARKQCTTCWLPIGHKNIFCVQSETSIRMSNGTGLLRVESQGLSRQFLKPFSAVYPDPHSNFLGSEILGIG